MILSLKLSVKALKLPFTKTQKAEFKNNASALNNNVFVDSAIYKLLGTSRADRLRGDTFTYVCPQTWLN